MIGADGVHSVVREILLGPERPPRRAAGPERVKRVDPLQLAKPLKWPALAIGVPGESCSSGAAPADGALGGLPAREQLNLFSHYV